MENHRETRCISAAFKFLLESDPDLDMGPDGPMKRSESDTALLACHKENLKNIQKSAQNGCAVRISEADQVLEEDRPGFLSKDQSSDMPCGGERPSAASKDNEKCVQMHLCEENVVIADTCVSSSEGAGLCNGCHKETETGSEAFVDYGRLEAQKTAVTEDDFGEVVLRSSCSSGRRKEVTDTAIISNVFEFLGTCSGSSSTHSQAVPEDGGKTSQEGCGIQMTAADLKLKADDNRAEFSQSVSAESGRCAESENTSDSFQYNLESIPETDGSSQVMLQSSKNSGVDVTQDAVVGSDSVTKCGAEKTSIEHEHRETLVTSLDVSEVRLRRARLSKQESTEDDGSNDSSDDDAGVYAESFRRSNWIRVSDDGKLELPVLEDSSKISVTSPMSSLSIDSIDCPNTPGCSQNTDDVFPELNQSQLLLSHKRSESVSTTLSEQEFKREYFTHRKCLIQRKESSREYHRLSAKVYDQEKVIVLEKRSCDSDYGLHIYDSQPAYITAVDAGSPAEQAGIQVGQIIVAINGRNMLTASHDAIISAMATNPTTVYLEVAASDFLPSRDLQSSVMEGYMQKLGGSSLMRLWKKRYFVLRQDSCLYYYKHQEEVDPLGAIPLTGYSISRHLDTGRDYCFKAEKYGARTYYFMTESRDEMTEWVIALVDAAARCKKRESFLSVSSHNVGLPALEVRRPECSGYLYKIGDRLKTWRRRYCILKDACLYYYKSMNSLSALGVAHLHGYKVDGQVSAGKKHAFAVVPPEANMRTFYFSAENDTDRHRWVEAMIRSIQRWIQVDNTC